MNKWLDFYTSFFNSEKEAEEFINRCESQTPPDNHAKIIMHQAMRLISLADYPKIKPHDESLQILFLMMCTENTSKLHDEFEGEGKSRYYVRQFFEKFLSQQDKIKLGNGFIDNNDMHLHPMGKDRVVDMLYDIRCDVVHEGDYSFFHFHDGTHHR